METNTNIDTLRDQTKSTAMVHAGFGNSQSFELMQRAAKALASSTLVPNTYRAVIAEKNGNVVPNPAGVPNCIIALNIAQRMGADPLMVMQSLHVIEGRPSWSAVFIIATINACGKYSPLRFKITEDENVSEFPFTSVEWIWSDQTRKKVRKENSGVVKIKNIKCHAYATELATGDVLEGPEVSLAMAIAEGWYMRAGSKWKTMEKVMLRYRASSLFGRIYSPELLMGLQSAEEVEDSVTDVVRHDDGAYGVVDIEQVRKAKAAADGEEVVDFPTTAEDATPVESTEGGGPPSTDSPTRAQNEAGASTATAEAPAPKRERKTRAAVE
jgi:hypothetical protein